MSRIGLLTLLFAVSGRLVIAQEAAAPAEKEATKPAENQPATPKPEAAAAREAFEALRQQWIETTKQLQTVDGQRRSAQGADRTKLDAQVADLRKQADEILKKITDAGLAVYKADPEAYPEINNTLIYIAQFFLSGDPNGDGGDQYEKALPLLKGLIDAGAGEKWPQLYLWGAIAAYCTNDFDLAEQY